jgi:hypothetical protein
MEIEPRWDSSGIAAHLRFRFQTHDGSPAGAFQIVHERALHLFVIRRDLEFFEHIHPQPDDSHEFAARMVFPSPGDYMLFADFAPEGAAPQMLQQMIVTPGPRGRTLPKPLAPQIGDQISQGLRFSLTPEELRAGSPALLTVMVFDAETGKPVGDLEQYLGAAGHMFFVSADLADGSHSHPLEPSNGPSIRFLTRFNNSGTYRLWLQVQRRGRVVTASWTLNVPEPPR